MMRRERELEIARRGSLDSKEDIEGLTGPTEGDEDEEIKRPET